MVWYTAGVENAKFFQKNTWEIISQEPPTPSMPLFVIILGAPKAGKTECIHIFHGLN